MIVPQQRGLLLLFTGNGKGKTTSAFGLALRAAGHQLKVCIIQFIKGTWPTGEAKAVRLLNEFIELHTLGSGFSWNAADFEEVRQPALKAWDFAREKIMSDHYDMIILDELTYLINLGIVEEKDIVALLDQRPTRQHVVVTGRDAGALLHARADLVTEMKEIKHPYQDGRAATKGIEY